MEGIQKDLDEASGLQVHLEQLHQELLSGLETLEDKTNWILSKITSDLPNSNEATTKLFSYQDSLKKTKQNLEGFNMPPFSEIVINPKLGVTERNILSELNNPLEVEEVTIGDTFLVKNEPSEEKETFDHPTDYEEFIEAEVKVELPQITHELRHGRTIFTKGASAVIVAEPGTIARPLCTENTQEIELVNLDGETTSKKKRTEDVDPNRMPSQKRLKQVPDSVTEDLLSEASYMFPMAIREYDNQTLTNLLEKEEIKKMIQKAVSINLCGMNRGRYRSYKHLANLAYNCVKHSVGLHEDDVLKKIQIINDLSACNKDLIGAEKKEGFQSNVFPPVLAPGIHVDLLLQLLENGANPLAQTKNNENLFHTFLSLRHCYSMPKLFEGCVKIIQKMPKDILRELLNSKDGIQKWTPLMKIFVQWGKPIPLNVFEAFAKAGANLSVEDPSGASLLSMALEQGYDIEVVKKILELGGDIQWKGEDGASLLHLAATNGNLPAVELFLESGLSANIKDNEGLTPLDYIVFKWKAWNLNDKYIEIGKKLNEWGGEFNTRRDVDQTLLHVVAGDSTQSYELAGLNVYLLISLGFRMDGVDGWGETPLHFACRAFEAQWKRHNPTKRKFTERKYDLNDGLMGIKYLIKAGAKIVKNKMKMTPADLINHLDVPEKVKNEMKKCFVQK